ncbi:hypothetical protein [Bacillus salipaludis]|uniref:Uncharacterized protein n=1 Tax=Bacillus salipaludis TaxID=2547811 RepID=A0ABW8RIP3_9BACI
MKNLMGRAIANIYVKIVKGKVEWYAQSQLPIIIEGMEMQTDENRSYLNLMAGKIVYVSQEAFAFAEDGEKYENLHEWQQDDVKIAYNVAVSFDKYTGLPSSFDIDIDKYDMMESYCYSLSDSNT